MIASLIILRRNRSKQYKQNFSVSSTSTTIPWKAKFINGHIYFELKDQWASLARSQKHPVLAGSWVQELLSIWMHCRESWQGSSSVPIMDSDKGPYIYDVHTEGGWGSLEICHVFADSTVFKQ